MKFDAIGQAYKRARHFTGRTVRGRRSYRLETVVKRITPAGAGIAALNYAWLLGHRDNDRLADLSVLNMWAESINRYCNSHKVSSDLNARLAMLAFLSALWFNPLRLADT